MLPFYTWAAVFTLLIRYIYEVFQMLFSKVVTRKPMSFPPKEAVAQVGLLFDFHPGIYPAHCLGHKSCGTRPSCHELFVADVNGKKAAYKRQEQNGIKRLLSLLR